MLNISGSINKWLDEHRWADFVIGMVFMAAIAGTIYALDPAQEVTSIVGATRVQSQSSSATTTAATVDAVTATTKDGLTTIVDVPILLWTPGPNCPDQKPVVARKRTTTIVDKQTTSDARKTAVIEKHEEVAKTDTSTSLVATVVDPSAYSRTSEVRLLPKNALTFSLTSRWSLAEPWTCGSNLALGLGATDCLRMIDVEYSRRLWQTPIWGVLGANINQFRVGLRVEF